MGRCQAPGAPMLCRIELPALFVPRGVRQTVTDSALRSYCYSSHLQANPVGSPVMDWVRVLRGALGGQTAIG
jgi:hypothetical protein